MRNNFGHLTPLLVIAFNQFTQINLIGCDIIVNSPSTITFLLLNTSFFSTTTLDTESLSELAKKSGEVTSSMADFFITLIQDLVPDSMFIHLGEFYLLFAEH